MSLQVVRNLGQVIEKCDAHIQGKCVGIWGGVSLVRKSDSHQGGVTGIRKVCQFMERSDGYVGGVKDTWPFSK